MNNADAAQPSDQPGAVIEICGATLVLQSRTPQPGTEFLALSLPRPCMQKQSDAQGFQNVPGGAKFPTFPARMGKFAEFGQNSKIPGTKFENSLLFSLPQGILKTLLANCGLII